MKQKYIDLIQKELDWCEENPDKNLSPEYQDGFKRGLEQAVRLLTNTKFD